MEQKAQNKANKFFNSAAGIDRRSGRKKVINLDDIIKDKVHRVKVLSPS